MNKNNIKEKSPTSAGRTPCIQTRWKAHIWASHYHTSSHPATAPGIRNAHAIVVAMSASVWRASDLVALLLGLGLLAPEGGWVVVPPTLGIERDRNEDGEEAITHLLCWMGKLSRTG